MAVISVARIRQVSSPENPFSSVIWRVICIEQLLSFQNPKKGKPIRRSVSLSSPRIPWSALERTQPSALGLKTNRTKNQPNARAVYAYAKWNAHAPLLQWVLRSARSQDCDLKRSGGTESSGLCLHFHASKFACQSGKAWRKTTTTSTTRTTAPG